MPLTPNAVQQRDVLERLRDDEPSESIDAFARELGRDPSNFRKTLKLLETDGLVDRTLLPDWPADLPSLRITDDGKRALFGMEVADGTAEVPPNAIRLTRDLIRRNPLNPRGEVLVDDELRLFADTIEATGVLQPLLVFPESTDGSHFLAAGERRWRAVGLLIDEGRWPKLQPIDCLVKPDADPKLAVYFALVENRQRKNMTWLQTARGYLSLVETEGWSARRAAIETGESPRVVQEMLKVLDEAPKHAIRALEAGHPDYTVEKLRLMVRTPAELMRDAAPVPGEPETLPIFPEQVDEVEAASAALGEPSKHTDPHFADAGYTPIRRDVVEQNASKAVADTVAVRVPNRREALAIVELAHKTAHHPITPLSEDKPGAEVHQYWTDGVASLLTTDLGMVNWVHHKAGSPVGMLTDKGKVWLWETYRVAIANPATIDDFRLQEIREALGYSLNAVTPYQLAWLNAPPAPKLIETVATSRNDPSLEAEDDPYFDALQQLLGDSAEMLVAYGTTGVSFLELHDLILKTCRALDVSLPLRAQSGDSAGSVHDATGEEILTVDVNRENPDSRAAAIGIMLALCVNITCGPST